MMSRAGHCAAQRSLLSLAPGVRTVVPEGRQVHERSSGVCVGPLIAQEPTLQELNDRISLDSQILTEQFYYFTVTIMWLIHVGFMSYEAGAGRRKNVMATAMKNILTIAVVTPTFFYFGWWIYGCFGQGIIPITPGDFFNAAGELLPGKTPSEGAMATFCSETYPWSANLAPNLTDHVSGVFWAAFLLFSWTTASILSGALIERARLSAYLLLACILGSVDLDPRCLVGLELVWLPPDPLGLP